MAISSDVPPSVEASNGTATATATDPSVITSTANDTTPKAMETTASITNELATNTSAPTPPKSSTDTGASATAKSAKDVDETAEFEGDLNTNNEIPSQEVLKKIENFTLLDKEGKAIPFRNLYTGPNVARRVLIIFVRHFFCGVSRRPG